MNYGKKFKHTVHEGKCTSVDFIQNEHGEDVPVPSVNPYEGLDPDSFKPINVIKAGGTLKPSPRLASGSLEDIDRALVAVDNLKTANDAIIAQAKELEELKATIEASKPHVEPTTTVNNE